MSGSLSVFEVEAYVKGLRCYPMREVGSERWMTQHEHLEALNLQAHRDAQQAKHDELVVESFSSHPASLTTLIHELLVIEAWKEKVFPLLLSHFSPVTAVKAYIVLYHEATLCNLIEVLLYHASIAEAAAQESSDAMLELGDYCVRKINALNTGQFKKLQEEPKAEDARRELNRSTQDQLRQQSLDIGFSVAVCAVSLLRFMSDHVSVLPLGVTSRLLHTHDVLLSLVPLVESPPWTRRRGGKVEKFSDQRWMAIAPQDMMLMTKLEGQVWLTLYNLLMDKNCRKQYQYNTHRKDVLVRLRRFFTDILLDQLPLLRELKRLIEELSIMAPPPPTASSLAIIEQVPEMREAVLADAKKAGDFAAIAEEQKRSVFANDEAARQRDIARLAATYSLDKFDDVLPTGPTCAACGTSKPGEMKRCSRCRNEWYCGRACQVAHWKKHQKLCDLMHKDAANKPKAAATATPNAAKPAAAASTTAASAAASSTAAAAAKPQPSAPSAASTTAKPAVTPIAAAPAAPATAAAVKKPLIEMLDDEDDAQNPLESPD